jgi:Lrp/AsnC family leucine-responsive transcriptional regulator
MDGLDRTDRRLLAPLQSDARLTYEELGQAVGLSAPAAYQRVRKLEGLGVILGYHGRVDPAAVGRPVAVLMRVQPGAATDVERLLRAWEQTEDILECYAMAGGGDYHLKLRLESLQSLSAHLDAARNSGCAVSADVIVSTAFERWTVPVS